jgi:hypothetical protein
MDASRRSSELACWLAGKVELLYPISGLLVQAVKPAGHSRAAACKFLRQRD